MAAELPPTWRFKPVGDSQSGAIEVAALQLLAGSDLRRYDCSTAASVRANARALANRRIATELCSTTIPMTSSGLSYPMNPSQEFRLTGIDSLEDIERALGTIHGHREYGLAVSAGNLNKRRGSLRDAAYLQALLTWSRLNPDAALNVGGGSEQSDSEILDEACGYSIGIAAMSVSGSVKVRGESVARQLALVGAKSRIEAAYQGDYASLVRGRTIDLLSVSGASRQFLKPLFNGPSPRQVKDKFDLKSTIRGLAMRAAPSSTDLDEGTLSSLATLTHELFENTQDHAIADERGQVYRRHVELLNVGWITSSEEDAKGDFYGNETLREYWEAISSCQTGRDRVSGLCFNFLDSGPGMAARLLGKPLFQMTEKEEASALRQCLRMHVTSKSNHATGLGLNAVLSEIAQAAGFVRIRSGRQAIFKCFLPGESSQVQNLDFENWFGPDRGLLRVAGTLVSIFIPLPRPTV